VECQNGNEQIRDEVDNLPEAASPGPYTTNDAKGSELKVTTLTERADDAMLARDAFARGDRR
jgi:hypothetical protein